MARLCVRCGRPARLRFGTRGPHPTTCALCEDYSNRRRGAGSLPLDGRVLRRILTVQERNAIVMRMRNGDGDAADRLAADSLRVSLDEFHALIRSAERKIARERERDPEPPRPVEEAAMDAAGEDGPTTTWPVSGGGLERSEPPQAVGPHTERRYSSPNAPTVLEWFREHPGWQVKIAAVQGTGLTHPQVDMALRVLRDDGLIEVKGVTASRRFRFPESEGEEVPDARDREDDEGYDSDAARPAGSTPDSSGQLPGGTTSPDEPPPVEELPPVRELRSDVPAPDELPSDAHTRADGTAGIPVLMLPDDKPELQRIYLGILVERLRTDPACPEHVYERVERLIGVR